MTERANFRLVVDYRRYKREDRQKALDVVQLHKVLLEGVLRLSEESIRNQQPVLDMGNMGCAGVYADVAAPGLIRRGDSVQLV